MVIRLGNHSNKNPAEHCKELQNSILKISMAVCANGKLVAKVIVSDACIMVMLTIKIGKLVNKQALSRS
jgi:hypothetical protein